MPPAEVFSKQKMQALAEGRLAPVQGPVSCYGHRLLSLYRTANIAARGYAFVNAPFFCSKIPRGSGQRPGIARVARDKKRAPEGALLVSLIGLVIIPLVFFACGPTRAESGRTHFGSC